jgi:hypothetical protein
VPSRNAGGIRRHAVALLIVACLVTAVSGASAQERPRPDSPEISEALEHVRADPNLAGTRTITLPRWQSTSTASGNLSWLRWLLQLMRYLAQSSRAIVYGVLFAAAFALLLYFIRTLAAREAARDGNRLITPTHVRDLDIRPESLPDDIGAAARRLWDTGQHRAALALLYRGLLSRLVHVHHLAIRDSTTEGDCLELIGAHLPEDRHQYSARLVRVWQRAVYGGTDPDSSIVYDLCDTFARALDATSWVPASTGTAGAASTQVTR